MGRFGILMDYILKHENGNTVAGYVNDPQDRGGETISGITRRNHPYLKVWKSLDQTADKRHYHPTENEWAEIYDVYRRCYYDRVRADDYRDINLALTVFDFAVNAGVSRAIKALQTVLGVEVDGIIGPVTMRAANSLKSAAEEYNRYRVNYYRSLNMPRFINGWMNRVKDCHVDF